MGRSRLSGYVTAMRQTATQSTEMDRLCLSLVNGSACLEEIAIQVAERFPQRFQRGQDALTYVADLLENYQNQTG